MLLRRHAGLRVAVVGDVGVAPLQVVRRNTSLPWRFEDWSGLDAAFAARLDDFLAADRARGFDFASAPLLRVCLLRRSPEHHLLIVSYHHLLLDGWSMPIVLGELLELYAALRQGEQAKLPAVRPYRDYLAWLKRQDRDAAQAFWRARLAGLTEPSRLELPRPAAGAAGAGEHDVVIAAELAGRLQGFAQSQHVTVNTLVQGAWALLLAGAPRWCSG